MIFVVPFVIAVVSCLIIDAANSTKIRRLTGTSYLDEGWLGVNNGPNQYRRDLGQGNPTVGGIEPSNVLYDLASPSNVSSLYKKMGIKSIRQNDNGGAWALECMFPVSDIDTDIPLPKDVANDPRWNWTETDYVFGQMIRNGFTPLIKLATRDSRSGRWNGLAYNIDGDVTTVIPPANPPGFCKSWPQTSPIIMKIGRELALTIVNRYNDVDRWRDDLFAAGIPPGPPLEPETWTSKPGLVGVELQNEYNSSPCPSANGNQAGSFKKLEEYKSMCGGPPFTWSSGYWDGTPQQAYKAYTSQAIAIHGTFPKINVGGPAIIVGPVGLLTPIDDDGNFAADDAGKKWVKDFLDTVKLEDAPLDFFSFHSYGTCKQTESSKDCGKDNPRTILGAAALVQDILKDAGFSSTPTVLSEFNYDFGMSPSTMEGAAFVGNFFASMAYDTFGMIGAYSYVGIDGPFMPHSTYGLPLQFNCPPNYTMDPEPGMIAPKIKIDGWKNDCLYSDNEKVNLKQYLGDSGDIGLIYKNGNMKPTGEMLTKLGGLLGKPLVNTSSLQSSLPSTIALFCVQTIKTKKEESFTLFFANADQKEAQINGVRNFVTSVGRSKVKIFDLRQYMRLTGFTVLLPNNMTGSGVFQAEGHWLQREIGFISEPFKLDMNGVVIIEISSSLKKCPKNSPRCPK